MPASLIGAVSGAASLGGSLLGASASKKAAKQAAAAQAAARAANEQAIQAQMARNNEAYAPLTPYAQAGARTLAQRAGLTLPAWTQAGGDVLQPYAPGQSDYGAYLRSNPDVMTWAQSGHGDPNVPIDQQSLEQRAAYQYRNTGQSEGRTLPLIEAPPSPQTSARPPAPYTPPPVQPGTYGTTANPTYAAAGGYQIPIYAMPQFTQTANYQDPGNFTYGLEDYTASPSYQWQQDQARNAVLASNSATGALRSGAALKSLQDRAQNVALTDFTNERAYNANQFNTDRNFNRGVYQDDRDYDRGVFTDDRNFGRQVFQDDRNFGRDVYTSDRAFDRDLYTDNRNYLTGRYDAQTANLNGLTSLGTGALDAQMGANNGLVNALVNSNSASANGISSAYGQAGSTAASLYGGIGNQFADIYNTIATNPINIR